MSVAVQDLFGALVAHLKTQSVVTDIAAQRVFALELPPEEAEQMPRHALVLQPAGAAPLPYTTTLALEGVRVDAVSYGATPFEAMKLRRAVRGAMKDLERVKVGTVLIHWALPSGAFADERDPQTRWPRVVESFSVLGAEPAAA